MNLWLPLPSVSQRIDLQVPLLSASQKVPVNLWLPLLSVSQRIDLQVPLLSASQGVKISVSYHLQSPLISARQRDDLRSPLLSASQPMENLSGIALLPVNLTADHRGPLVANLDPLLRPILITDLRLRVRLLPNILLCFLPSAANPLVPPLIKPTDSPWRPLLSASLSIGLRRLPLASLIPRHRLPLLLTHPMLVYQCFIPSLNLAASHQALPLPLVIHGYVNETYGYI